MTNGDLIDRETTFERVIAGIKVRKIISGSSIRCWVIADSKIVGESHVAVRTGTT
jgi:hypothetical protein